MTARSWKHLWRQNSRPTVGTVNCGQFGRHGWIMFIFTVRIPCAKSPRGSTATLRLWLPLPLLLSRMTAVPPISQLFLWIHGAGQMDGGRSSRGPFVAQVLPLLHLPALVTNLSKIGADLKRAVAAALREVGLSDSFAFCAELDDAEQMLATKRCLADQRWEQVPRATKSPTSEWSASRKQFGYFRIWQQPEEIQKVLNCCAT
jgi:hypothetical protein